MWAQLRRELAAREQADLSAGRVLTVPQFRQRAAQILQGYSVPAGGQELSFLSKLVRGMPGRLANVTAPGGVAKKARLQGWRDSHKVAQLYCPPWRVQGGQ